jgi:hypothetical protein
MFMFTVHVNKQTKYLTQEILNTKSTERRGRVVNTPASYSWVPSFDSRLRRPAYLTEGFRRFPQFLKENAGIVP